MSDTVINVKRQDFAGSSTFQTSSITRASSRSAISPTPVTDTWTYDASRMQLDTSIPVPSATVPGPNLAIATAVGTCLTNSDCDANRVCSEQRCLNSNEVASLADSQPISRSSTSFAVWLPLSIVALVAIVMGLGLVYWRGRVRRQPNPSSEAPPHVHDRSFSNSTRWTIENDQRTLVASLPSSPQDARFSFHNTMAPAAFEKAMDVNDTDNEKAEDRRQASLDERNSVATTKALPTPPAEEIQSLPAAYISAADQWALSVNINKSMIFDEDMMRAVSPSFQSSTLRERMPKYRFEEVIPSVAVIRPTATYQQPVTTQRNSIYELEQLPSAEPRSTAELPAEVGSCMEDASNNVKSEQTSSLPQGEPLELADEETSEVPQEEERSCVTSLAPQLSTAEMSLPSPSFSFRSYDWYQDIIENQSASASSTHSSFSRSPATTPTKSVFPLALPSPRSLALPTMSDTSTSLFSEQPAHIPFSPLGATHLHPGSAAVLSPTNPNFRLSPTVYQMPSRSPSPSPRSSPRPKSSPRFPSIVSPKPVQPQASAVSALTRATHDSRSWLPEDGLFLAEEGSPSSYEIFRRTVTDDQATGYSPLG